MLLLWRSTYADRLPNEDKTAKKDWVINKVKETKEMNHAMTTIQKVLQDEEHAASAAETRAQEKGDAKRAWHFYQTHKETGVQVDSLEHDYSAVPADRSMAETIILDSGSCKIETAEGRFNRTRMNVRNTVERFRPKTSMSINWSAGVCWRIGELGLMSRFEFERS